MKTVPSLAVMIPLVLFGLAVIITLLGSFFTVKQQTSAVIQRFGKFIRVAESGLSFKVPWIDRIAGRINLRVQQLDVEVDTKTKDNVFVRLIVSVQYAVLSDKVYEAFYKLQDPEKQITAYVFDVVRAQVPKMNLDEVFDKKEDVANAVKSELDNTMGEFGYNIVQALVTDIVPDEKVSAAMNEINANERLKIAATSKGEAEKIGMVKRAEGEAESKKLQGEGIANQRRAIIEGLKTSVTDFQQSVEGSTAQDVMNLVLMTQYFDTMKDIGAQGKSSTILIPHTPGFMADLSGQMRDAVLVGNKLGNNGGDPEEAPAEQ